VAVKYPFDEDARNLAPEDGSGGVVMTAEWYDNQEWPEPVPAGSVSQELPAPPPEQSAPGKVALQFGPRDPSPDKKSKGKVKRARTDSGYSSCGEDMSVEELRAEWMLKRLQKSQESVECHETSADDEVSRTDGAQVLASGISCSSDARRLSGASVSSAGTASAASALNQEATLTQEITTTCVEALFRCGGSSRPSVASSSYTNFDDPTCTMQEVQCEVLGLFSSDLPKRVASQQEACDIGDEQGPSPQKQLDFEIFQETNFSAPEQWAGDALFTGGLENASIGCSGEPELHSSAMQVWGDSELDMAMS